MVMVFIGPNLSFFPLLVTLELFFLVYTLFSFFLVVPICCDDDSRVPTCSPLAPKVCELGNGICSGEDGDDWEDVKLETENGGIRTFNAVSTTDGGDGEKTRGMGNRRGIPPPPGAG